MGDTDSDTDGGYDIGRGMGSRPSSPVANPPGLELPSSPESASKPKAAAKAGQKKNLADRFAELNRGMEQNNKRQLQALQKVKGAPLPPPSAEMKKAAEDAQLILDGNNEAMREAAAKAALRARRQAKKSVGCVKKSLQWVEDVWYATRKIITRRRNSFLLYRYHSLGALVSFVMAFAGLFTNIAVWKQFLGMWGTCDLDDVVHSDADLRNITKRVQRAVTCKWEEGTPSACELYLLKAMLNICLTIGIVSSIQFVTSLALALSFRLFTNIPRERLHYVHTECSVRFVGAFCKFGPWITRFFHLILGLTIVALCVLVGTRRCYGDVSKVSTCKSYDPSCTYNVIKNCKYYYSFCEPNPDKDLACFTIAGRDGFSGRMDIRLLVADECMRCAILKRDLADPKSIDEYYLLNESHRYNKTVWKCKEYAHSCFHTVAWRDLACDCENAKTVVDFENPVIATWWDSFKCSTTNAAPSRRLDDALQAPSPENMTGEVFADSVPRIPLPLMPPEEVLDEAEIHLRGTLERLHGRPAPEFALDYEHGIVSVAPAPAQCPHPVTPGLSVVRSFALWPSMVAEVREDASRRLQQMAQSTGGKSGSGGDRQDDSMVKGGISDFDPTDAMDRPCIWAESEAEYNFDKVDCNQDGSVAFRFVFVLADIVVGCWVFLTLLGQLLRLRSKPEPWFHNPYSSDESWIKKLIRLAGP